MKKKISAIILVVLAAASVTGCASKRQISVEGTGSEQVQGTSWLRFCDGPNAFIWVQSYTDSEPDELEAIIYDHWACVDSDTTNDTGTEEVPADGPIPDADSDGTIDDEEN